MKISSRQACLPLLITAILFLYSQALAQEPIRVFIGNPDCSPFDVPAQGVVRFPLRVEMPEAVGGAYMRLAIVEPTLLHWRSMGLYYLWQYGYDINGPVMSLWFVPEGDYLDSLLLVADILFRIDADSTYYGQTLQAIVAFDVTFWDTTGMFIYDIEYCVSPLCIECQTSIKDSPQVPDEISCSAYPNPFNSSVTISFTLPHDGEAAVTIYDIMGRRVRSLGGNILRAGLSSLVWDATDDRGAALSSGVYFYILEFGEYTAGSKLVLLK